MKFPWFMRKALNVLPYISLCKEAHPSRAIFCADFILTRTNYKPCPKDAVISKYMYLDRQFMRRRFSKIHQILHIFVLY